MEGLPYHLYTDASDEAAGCTLQQIQPIAVKDLAGTRAYRQLKRAYNAGLPPLKLMTTISSKFNNAPPAGVWGRTFDETVVHTEWVIAYYSRCFKGAEQRYSTTEHEALAAKEGLAWFQPLYPFSNRPLHTSVGLNLWEFQSKIGRQGSYILSLCSRVGDHP